MRISDWSSDVCSSDLVVIGRELARKFEKALRQLDADRGKLGRHRPFGLALQAKARAHQWRSVKGKKEGGLQHIFVDCFADCCRIARLKLNEMGVEDVLSRLLDRKSTRLNSSH